MFIETVVAALFIGILRGGRFRGLEAMAFKVVPSVIIAFLAQLLINYWGLSTLGRLGLGVHLGTYVLIFYFLWSNWSILNSTLTLGIWSNFLVIFVNGGSMPVKDPGHAAFSAEKLMESVTHHLFNSNTVFPWLADVIFVPWPFMQMISIGDILINVGMFLLIQKNMHNHNIDKS